MTGMTYGEATIFLDWIIDEYLNPRDGVKAHAALNTMSNHFRRLVQEAYEEGVKDGQIMEKARMRYEQKSEE